MNSIWKTIIWQQLGAAIDMLENTMRACPDDLWSDRSKRPEWVSRNIVGFWYVVYHTLFWLDHDLSDSVEEFAPPAPYTLGEMDPAGLLPERPYTKEELQSYLDHDRNKCRAAIEALTDENARQHRGCERVDVSVAELLLYHARHVQHHAAQLNLIFRQATDSAPRWVAKTKSHYSGE